MPPGNRSNVTSTCRGHHESTKSPRCCRAATRPGARRCWPDGPGPPTSARISVGAAIVASSSGGGRSAVPAPRNTAASRLGSAELSTLRRRSSQVSSSANGSGGGVALAPASRTAVPSRSTAAAICSYRSTCAARVSHAVGGITRTRPRHAIPQRQCRMQCGCRAHRCSSEHDVVPADVVDERDLIERQRGPVAISGLVQVRRAAVAAGVVSQDLSLLRNHGTVDQREHVLIGSARRESVPPHERHTLEIGVSGDVVRETSTTQIDVRHGDDCRTVQVGALQRPSSAVA